MLSVTRAVGLFYILPNMNNTHFVLPLLQASVAGVRCKGTEPNVTYVNSALPIIH